MNSLVRPKLLIVDDEPELARMLRIICEAAGYRADVASSGAEGLAAFERERFDAVLVDARVAARDGSGLVRAVHRLTHVVGVTAQAEAGERMALLEAGAVRVLHKPYTVREVHAVLAELLA